MTIRLLTLCALLAAALGLGCDEGSNLPSVAFGSPTDFTYACAGTSQTFKPALSGDADLATVCAADGTTPSSLFGLVLNRQPPRVHVLQMAVDGSLPFGVIDADRFVPGFSGIPVDEAPLRRLRSDDWSAFYILSSGAQSSRSRRKTGTYTTLRGSVCVRSKGHAHKPSPCTRARACTHDAGPCMCTCAWIRACACTCVRSRAR